MRLKAGSTTEEKPTPPVQQTIPVQPVKKALLAHLPYECISTKSPDGRDHWPNIARVTPPADFRDSFNEMVKVGCYCWRIVDKVVFSSKGDRKQERVLAVTAEFLFICDLSANINRVLRCRDIERVLIQETPSTTVVVFKAYDQCEEHSVMIELNSDPRNPNNKPLHPIFALNYTRKPKTKTDLEMIRVAPTTDLRRHPAAGCFTKPQGYLAPHLKIQKWRETGKWPCGSSSIPPTARSVPGAHKLKTMDTLLKKSVTFVGDGQETSIRVMANGGLEWVAGGSAVPIESLKYNSQALTLSSQSCTVNVMSPEPGPKLDTLLRDLAMLAAKARVPATGLPITVRRQKVKTFERSASVDSIDRMKQAAPPREASPTVPNVQALMTEIRFTDTDGDVSVLRLLNGKLEWWANGSLEVPACSVIKFHDGVLTSGPVSARIAVPTGEERKEMFRLVAYVAQLVGVKVMGLPIIGPGETMALPVITTSMIEKRETLGGDARSDAGSVTSSVVSTSTASYRHNPYATDDEDAGGTFASPASSFSSTSSAQYIYNPTDPYSTYPRQVPSPVPSMHSDQTDASHPSLLSSLDALNHASDRSDTSADHHAPMPSHHHVPHPVQPVMHYNPAPAPVPAPVSPPVSSAPPPPSTQAQQAYVMTDVTAHMQQLSPMNLTHVQPAMQEGACMRLAVMFKHGRRGEYASRLAVPPRAYVLVEHPDGMDIALVVGVRQGGRVSDKWKVLRTATQEEVLLWQSLVVEEETALEFMREYVAHSGVPITLHRAEYQIDKKKLTFHFSSEVLHPDFVSLVHHAHARFGCRIWMNNCQPRKGERGELIDLSSEPCPTY
eukprot:TRINITY_DN9022_c3_g1_i1.p1 TRINITY_DN9022_c3_g1~~TRINITY_DN9022_c3_g1_i1.p1  ORF type:complete len:882 (+),score=228.46 TRINITY_DN9022_c3_g1_i1:138-2648(+)